MTDRETILRLRRAESRRKVETGLMTLGLLALWCAVIWKICIEVSK